MSIATEWADRRGKVMRVEQLRRALADAERERPALARPAFFWLGQEAEQWAPLS